MIARADTKPAVRLRNFDAEAFRAEVAAIKASREAEQAETRAAVQTDNKKKRS